MTKDTIIEVNNLVKKYGKFTAVNGVSFDVKEGEIFGILGPNGAGKTTILEIMETLRDETDGDVVIGGYSINKEPDKIKSIIGVQLQSSGFPPELNLKEILQVFASLYNAKINIDELLDKVLLKDKKNSKVNQLSGGQKQRFSIATTIVHEPQIIFLDEPSTGLDPQSRRNLWDLITSIRDSGATIVLTTHFMDEAEFLCDRVAILDGGKTLDIDTPKNLIAKLLKNGFEKKECVQEATLEDVFLNLTGKNLRE